MLRESTSTCRGPNGRRLSVAAVPPQKEMEMNRVRKKAYTEMDTTELAEATAELDKEFVADSFGEPPEEAKAAWRRAIRRPGRPMKGRGVKVISVSVERDLLVRCDNLAKRKGITRASIVSRGLRAVLAAEKTR
jgi:hypothetical protein